MTQQLTLDATPTTQDEHKVQGRLLALGFFILVVAIVAVTALIGDRSLSPDGRIAVFQQSSVYP